MAPVILLASSYHLRKTGHKKKQEANLKQSKRVQMIQAFSLEIYQYVAAGCGLLREEPFTQRDLSGQALLHV